MRWLQVGVVVLSVMALIGCPSEFGKDGRIAKAVHKDTMGVVRRICSDKERWEVCNGPNKDPEKCRECGG
jgi:hypothetical protein